MAVETIKNADFSVSKESIHHLLFILNEAFTNFASEAERSSSLLLAGEKTELCKSCEEIIKDPVSALSDTANSVDNTINTLIQRIVQLYLKNISPIIDSSYFYMNDRNDHVYFIIPKEDNAENRDAIFGFFEEYNSYPISGKFPVTFQVVPPDLKNRLPFDLLKKTNA